MNRSRADIKADIVTMLRRLADDWEYGGEITENTRMLADLGFESLDVVVLGTVIQDHYGQTLPFPEFFAEIGQRAIGDVSIGEWVDFVHKHLNGASP